jgi:DNA invertase Pin-like site-specific DNA recombinase
MANGKFVSYLRVSTARQGASGLGLEAQREAVSRYLNGGDWTLVKEVVEVESGKRNDRAALTEALMLCRIHRATLVIAKLDRLARDAEFLLKTVRESGERGAVFCDLPMIPEGPQGKFIITQMAGVAELEGAMISQRTKAALAVAKARGKKLGGLRVPAAEFAALSRKGSAAGAAVRAAKAAKRTEDLQPLMEYICAEGATSLRAIAAELNARGIETPRGRRWYPIQVQRVLRRMPAAAVRKQPAGMLPVEAQAAAI